MSKFTQNEETEIVKSARDITATIEYEEREVKRPVRKILEKAKKVEPKYPEKPQTALKYSEYFKESIEEKLAKFSLPVKILLGIVSIPLISTGIIFLILVIIVAVSYKDYIIKKKELNNQLANSKEYLQAVANAEKKAQDKQNELE